jgi:hypothetical protein
MFHKLMSNMGAFSTRGTMALSTLLYTRDALEYAGCPDAGGTVMLTTPAATSASVNTLQQKQHACQSQHHSLITALNRRHRKPMSFNVFEAHG